MKAFKLISSALLSSVLVVSTAFGGEVSSKSNAAEVSVREQIASTLSDVPAGNGEVYVYFSASAKNGFGLLRVIGADNQLVDKVKDQLSNGKIEVPNELNGNYFVKVRFADSKNVVEQVSSEELLRNSISEVLDKVDASNGVVTLYFTVKGNKLTVKKAEGSNKSLVALVEKTLNNRNIDLAENLSGNYQIDVKF